METLTADLCIIGAGSGGLSVAAAAVQMGAKVVLVENKKMGGDCLNYGCVPSKALIAAARVAHTFRSADQFGIRSQQPEVDYTKVNQHVHEVIAAIAPHDSVERFERLGVKVISATARFFCQNAVVAGDYKIKARRFVIATGSSAAVPAIPGLNETPFLTNETVFDLTIKPEHLVVIGGGPIGCELAQAYVLLGAKVTLLEMFSIMPKDDAELVAVVRQRLIKDGLQLHEGVKVIKTEKTAAGIAVVIEQAGKQQRVEGTHLLVAAGRKPNVQGLDLEKAKVVYSPHGIQVNKRLQTTNKKIFAIGDVVGGYQFTHVANYHAGIVIRNALFGLPAKVNYQALPWVTYTEPELAHVGLTEQQAQQKNIKIKVLRMNFSENDRAQTECQTEGMIKVVASEKGQILGATIVGLHAGELIAPWVSAINNKLKIKSLAEVIIPYPTLSEINKRVAGQFYLPMLTSSATKRIVKILSYFL